MPLQRGALFAILSNRIYRGEIVHKGTAYPGEHEPIIDRELWDKVQDLIAANRTAQKLGTRAQSPSLLAGIITDGLGRKMSPSHARKGQRRYRYYITHVSELTEDGPPVWRMPALDVETAVIQRTKLWLADKQAIRALFPNTIDAHEIERLIASAAKASIRLDDPSHKRKIISQAIADVQVHAEALEIRLRAEGLGAILKRELDPQTTMPILRTSAIKLRQGKTTKLVLHADDGTATVPDPALVGLLREAQAARSALFQTPGKSVRQIALERRVCRHRLARLIRLSWLAPDIVTALIEGRHPASLTTRALLETDLPIDWAGQKRVLGLSHSAKD